MAAKYSFFNPYLQMLTLCLCLYYCLQNHYSKNIQEKESEHESYEVRISEVDLPRLDEKERNAVLY